MQNGLIGDSESRVNERRQDSPVLLLSTDRRMPHQAARLDPWSRYVCRRYPAPRTVLGKRKNNLVSGEYRLASGILELAGKGPGKLALGTAPPAGSWKPAHSMRR